MIVGFVLFAQFIDKECVAPFVIFYDTPLSEKPSFVEANSSHTGISSAKSFTKRMTVAP